MHDHIPCTLRDALKCLAWAGTGALWALWALWALRGGVASSSLLGDAANAKTTRAASFTFLQLGDSHVGFAKAANPDARLTYRGVVSKVIAMPVKADFIIHTGDIT